MFNLYICLVECNKMLLKLDIYENAYEIFFIRQRSRGFQKYEIYLRLRRF